VAGAKPRPKQAFPSAAQLPPGPKDWIPPADQNIQSLFVTGIEDDLPEHKIRDFFKAHGKIKSLVCSHMSHCAFVNYETREAAEKAAAACQGKAVIAGCPLRVRWAQPKPIGTMNKEQRHQMLMDARQAVPRQQRGPKGIEGGGPRGEGAESTQAAVQANGGATSMAAVAPPPGAQDEPQYASLAGN
jgi:pre-mRNA-splicing factor RBM22/SLT11